MTREEAIRTLNTYRRYADGISTDGEGDSTAFDMAIEALQDRPSGKWIVKQGNYCGVELKEFYCDKCGTRGALRRVFSDSEPLPNFCGHCGADMRGGADD